MAVWTETTATLGEVRVETGTGLVDKLEHTAGKRNAQIKIKATHANLKELVTGWVDTADSGVWDIAQAAKADNFEIEYRIEVHRKAGVDLATPIKEVGNRDKVRDVARLTRKGELSQADRQAPDNAAVDDQADDHTDPPPPPTAAEKRPRVREEKPWELRNSDNSLNLGSWSYEAALEFAGFAHRLIGERNASLDPPETEIRIGQVKALADTLLVAADRAQANTRPDGHIDRQTISHKRARQAIRSAIHAHPVPWGVDPDARALWVDDLVDYAVEILGVAYDLFRYHETGDPR